MIRSFLVLDRDLKNSGFLLSLAPSCLTFPFRERFLSYTLPPIDMAIEGVGCHAGKGGGGGGQIFKKKERKERTREVTVRPEIMCDRSKTVSG